MPEYQAVVTPENIEVELKPHVGIRSTRIGPVEQVLPQDVVFVNGVWSGYVAHTPDAQINLLHSNLPEDIVSAIKQRVDAIRQADGQYGPTRSITQTTELQDNNVAVEGDSSLKGEDL